MPLSMPMTLSAHGPARPAGRRGGAAPRTVRGAAAVALSTALTGTLLAWGAAPARAEGPPVQGRFYLQNLATGDNLSGASGSDPYLSTHRPRGDEDRQQWEFQATGTPGDYRIRNADGDGRCLTRAQGQGGTRVALGDCGAAGTDWTVRRTAGERYAVHVPGTQERMVGNPGQGQVTFATAPRGDAETWYATPVDPPRAAKGPDPTLDQMTYLTAHNAFQNTEDDPIRFIAPNQPHSIERQLKDGVRGLMLDTYNGGGGEALLCHGSCGPGQKTFASSLATVANFLRQDTGAIVTLSLENYASRDQLKASLAKVPGISDLVFRPDAPEWDVRNRGWPKVSSLVAANKRLLILASSDGLQDLGVMHDRHWTVENYWSMGPGLGAGNWSCYSRWGDVPLGKEEPRFRRLFVMNHFRDVPMAPTYTNDNAKLQNRAERFCMPAARRKPNFLAVDQYKNGNPFAAVAALDAYSYHGDTPGWGRAD
ncbi:phosphatidylinositol-specific phospholipase C domain-containing protein [Streptomyces sp. NPDC050504]|uniref:phosphatidylinositol-specific phospholipase C domain-containing protein n=1 Tax=Streptomyces sp. NPDC050504 TaxID=3365618 RepID=UPI0037BA03D3